MDKLPMQSRDLAAEKFAQLAALFPQAVTETIVGYDADGKAIIERAVDPLVLQQEISIHVLEGREERYQFTWPDKRRAMVKSNSPATVERRDSTGTLVEVPATLRPCREESVDFDTTQNLYIEGDNLDVLKLLRETYLGRVKMIYIDPPYNTGSDFVYNDDFSEEAAVFLERDGQVDDDGNRMVKNLDSNGRFHTDWLNMIYPRLRIARDLLAEDGVIFISIDDGEVAQLRKICDEVFGERNFKNQIAIRRGPKSVQAQFDTWDKLGQGFEHILLYTKTESYRFPRQMKPLAETRLGAWNNHWRGTDRPTMRYPLFGITPATGQWRWGRERSEQATVNYSQMLLEIGETEVSVTQLQIDQWFSKQGELSPDLLRLSRNGRPEHYVAPTDETLLNSSWMDLLIGSSSEITQLFGSTVFDTAKLTSVISRMLRFSSKDSLILDFFSGSATTAHAVMQLNSEDGGNRRFIMVQLPEVCPANSEAAKAGYANIAEIGKERIRRAGAKIKSEVEASNAQLSLGEDTRTIPDIGFRVLKLDSTNMREIYYTPDETARMIIDGKGDMLIDNIKEDRNPEDLLFQVMLDLGVPLSARIEMRDILGADVFFVEYGDGHLVACFGKVTGEIVTAIAKSKPFFAVFRDGGFEDDNAFVNAEQIFQTYSPDTQRRVL